MLYNFVFHKRGYQVATAHFENCSAFASSFAARLRVVLPPGSCSCFPWAPFNALWKQYKIQEYTHLSHGYVVLHAKNPQFLLYLYAFLGATVLSISNPRR